MDQLGAIALFNKVVETGSFSAAGRQSNLAPSSVSRRIVDLEAWLGATLFHRTTRKLNLTEAGLQFHKRTRELLLDLEEARVMAASLEEAPAGLVRISVPASLEQHIVVATAVFQARWLEVSFGLTSTDLNVDLVGQGLHPGRSMPIQLPEIRTMGFVEPQTSQNDRLLLRPMFGQTTPIQWRYLPLSGAQ